MSQSEKVSDIKSPLTQNSNYLDWFCFSSNFTPGYCLIRSGTAVWPIEFVGSVYKKTKICTISLKKSNKKNHYYKFKKDVLKPNLWKRKNYHQICIANVVFDQASAKNNHTGIFCFHCHQIEMPEIWNIILEIDKLYNIYYLSKTMSIKATPKLKVS